MKPSYLLIALLAVGLAACEAKVNTAPPASSSSTTRVEVTKPAEAPTAPPASSTTSSTTSSTVSGGVSTTTPSGTVETSKSATVTTETKK